jgi:hypothetical protein
MLYVNLNDKSRLLFDTVAPFYGKEVTNDGPTQAIGVALEAIATRITALKAALADRPVNYIQNEVELEDVWREVVAIVDAARGETSLPLVGESPGQTQSETDIAPVTKPRLRKGSKKKA